MAAVATSALPCGSTLASSASSSSSRRLLAGRSLKLPCAGRPLKLPSQPGSAGFGHLSVRATISTDEPATTTVSPTPILPATSSTEEISALQTDELLADLQARWDAIENKTNVFIYAGGALVALWLSSTVVGAVNSVPLLSKILELVGFGYSGWFVYRYILFKENRKQLVVKIEELKGKVTGAAKDVSDQGLQ